MERLATQRTNKVGQSFMNPLIRKLSKIQETVTDVQHIRDRPQCFFFMMSFGCMGFVVLHNIPPLWPWKRLTAST